MTVNKSGRPAFRPEITDLAIAFALLTRIPLPQRLFPPFGARPAAYAAWAYPLVGLALGGLTAGVAFAAMAIGVRYDIAALFGLMAGILCTGAMHEDGLADCADGFWGGFTPERRLEIMRDSQIGVYGVIALVVSLLLRWLCLALLCQGGHVMPVLLLPVISRATMVAVMHALPNARQNGLSHQTGVPPRSAVAVAIGIGALAVLPMPGNVALGVFFGAIAATATVAMLARAKIAGQTGDVLGAVQQSVEAITLVFAATVLASVESL
ncbi:MAG: adenosylcobinamide-GDP ribazoletransferase [Pseudomonadota bacterium]